MSIDIVALDESREPQWDAFVRTHPDATVYHLSAWRRALTDAFPVKPRYLMALSGGEVAGVMPLMRQKSLLFGDRFTSLPFCTYGGPLGTDAAVEERLLHAATTDVAACGASYLEVRGNRIPSRPDVSGLGSWEVSRRKVGVFVRVDDTPDRLLARMDKTRRYDIRTAERHGITFSLVNDESGLNEFYAVFSRSMRDLGTPVYPRSFFRAIASRLSGVFGFAFARHGEQAIAAALVAQWRGVLEIPLLGSLHAARATAATPFLYWKLMEYAAGAGLRECDFGRSTRDCGTHKFKLKFGGIERELPWLYFLPRGGALPALNREASRFQSLIGAWQHLPLWVANSVGPMLASRLY